MASKFHSRLVGTVILVAVGIIVLPDLLDGKKEHYKDEIASIPIKPELESEMEVFELLDPVEDQIVLPESPVELTVGDTTNDGEVADTSQPLPTKVNSVDEKNDYVDSAWIIQLMALKNADNAETLVKDLQKRGYQAHTKNENGFTRVIIGPDVSKSKLEQQLVELKKITGSNGRLLKFKPLNP
ncbi:SPOR domain-containing protein [Vibrio sp. YMD68]|uniref:SPOR domain-containing protein n=1 Tax=Vibrio sp. YMD68 TaxID=3042300 RepID=UPI00249BA337|nr:SPOR domain-containing protein [Vibrio sp. YMD68]WGV99516.1 SPOR domain-containing protein [Vibrio sp. YMD68]